jgi:hypothetical protein
MRKIVVSRSTYRDVFGTVAYRSINVQGKIVFMTQQQIHAGVWKSGQQMNWLSDHGQPMRQKKNCKTLVTFFARSNDVLMDRPMWRYICIVYTPRKSSKRR